MTTTDASIMIAACAALLLAAGRALPAIVAVFRERAKAEATSADASATTAETVRRIAAAMVDTLRETIAAHEMRIAGLESDHETCREEVRVLRGENGDLRARISELEDKLDAQAEEIVTLHGKLALREAERDAAIDQAEALAEERARLARDVAAGGGSDRHRHDAASLAVDVVIAGPAKGRGRSDA